MRFPVTYYVRPGPPPAFPPIARLALNASQAAGRLIGATFTGQPTTVSPDLRTQRLTICRAGCPYYTSGRCRHDACGCVLAWKTALATEHCPDGRW
jgi:hypothetical protein